MASVRLLAAVVIGALAVTAPALAVQFTGEVTGVPQGDTLIVKHEGKVHTIRLHGVLAPEKSQPYAGQATAFMAKLAMGQTVHVIPMGKDRQKQVSAEVLLDGKSLNDQLVREGFAWWNHKQTRGGRLRTLQAAARAERRGLWADSDPIPPWDWKKGVRPSKKD